MKKRLFFAFLGALILVGVLAGIKYLQIDKMMAAQANYQPQAQAVTATQVKRETWERKLTAVGSLSAVQGVTVAAELPGKVVEIAFQAGQEVDKGDLLIRQDTSTEEALLPGARASLKLAETNLARAERLLADHAVSQAEVDAAQAARLEALSNVRNLEATIAKKQIHAPFAGRLGVRQVHLGQILEAGSAIVTLQSLDPIFVDFMIPQQQLPLLQEGLPLRVAAEAFPEDQSPGKVTTISPQVDEATRNIAVQGLLQNPEQRLRPGMYAEVVAVLPEPKEVLAIPVTAILYAPYGNSVFVIEPADQQQKGNRPDQEGADQAAEATPAKQTADDEPSQDRPLVLRQQFVRIGEKRGDFAEILSGLEAGETVATTGVFKLRNGQPVKIDNSLQPEFERDPTPANK